MPVGGCVMNHQIAKEVSSCHPQVIFSPRLIANLMAFELTPISLLEFRAALPDSQTVTVPIENLEAVAASIHKEE